MAPSASAQPITIQPIRNEGELFQALAIREVVFIEEQHVPEGIERDAEDQKAFHVLAMAGGHAIGTGRLVNLTDAPHGETGKWGQIGRMAVLQAHRKGGVGSKLLIALETEAKRLKADGIVLHAQLYAKVFYERHGYQVAGPVFQEAGMDHIAMTKKLL